MTSGSTLLKFNSLVTPLLYRHITLNKQIIVSLVSNQATLSPHKLQFAHGIREYTWHVTLQGESVHPCLTSWRWLLSGLLSSSSSTKPRISLSNVAPTTSSATNSSCLLTVTESRTRVRRKSMEYARHLVLLLGSFAKCRYPSSCRALSYIYIYLYTRHACIQEWCWTRLPVPSLTVDLALGMTITPDPSYRHRQLGRTFAERTVNYDPVLLQSCQQAHEEATAGHTPQLQSFGPSSDLESCQTRAASFPSPFTWFQSLLL